MGARSRRTWPAHVADMLTAALDPTAPGHKGPPVRAVLMDTWYATRPLLRQIEQLGQVYYCPLKPNRLVDPQWAVTGDRRRYTYTPVGALRWTAREHARGKEVHLKD